MSLLMDALKRAERARAARQEDSDDGDAEEHPLSLDPMEPREPASDVGASAGPGGASGGGDDLGFERGDLEAGRPQGGFSGGGYASSEFGEGASHSDEQLTESDAFELEDYPDRREAPAAGGFDAGARMEATDDSIGLSLSEEQLRSVEDSLTERPMRRPEDSLSLGAGTYDATAATLPSLNAARDSVNTYFDGTASGSLAMEQVNRGHDDDTTITGRRAALERDSEQEQARAVFAAKAARRPSSVGRWVLFLGLPVVLVAAAVGMYFYWLASGGSTFRGPAIASTPGGQVRVPARPAPAPGRTEGGVGSGAASAAANTPAPSSGSASGPSASAVASAPSISAARASRVGEGGSVTEVTPADAPALSAAAARQARAPSSGDLSPSRILGEQPDPAVVPDNTGAVLSDAQFEAMLRQRASLPKGFDRSGGIKITRGRGRARTTAHLEHAYEHYVNGELSRAEQTYRSILRREPRNRDALLGLAAISLRYGDIDAAKERYLRVLAAHPQDAVAQAALIDVFTDIDPLASESQLKGLIGREPSAGYLHFALGNAYARQGRWAEAQAAYFEAFRTDDANPDYAFNLAVSLDQLGQRTAARQYYQQALDLGDRRPSAFSSEAVLARLRDLGAS